MDKSSPVHLPKKFSSFSSSPNEDKPREMDRNLSLGCKLERSHQRRERENTEGTIEEGDEEEEDEDDEAENQSGGVDDANANANANAEEPEASFDSVTDDVDKFLQVLSEGQHEAPPEIPELALQKFLDFIEAELSRYESVDVKWSPNDDELGLLTAVSRVSKLTSALSEFSSDTKYNDATNRAGSLLHHAMSFLEDEFHSMLEDPRTKQDTNAILKTKRPPSFARLHEPDRSVLPSTTEVNPEEPTPAYPPDIVERLQGIADAMISAGYVTECCQLFTIARRNAYEAGLSSLGYDKHSIDDIVKMPWETLETEVATWIKTFKHTVSVSFTAERELCDSIFTGHAGIIFGVFHGFARGIVLHMLTFPEAVAMTKRSAEKLFKVLDMYETLRDTLPALEALFPIEAEEDTAELAELKQEIMAIKSRLGEVAVSIFCELENSIKNDYGKTPVQGGAVHPLIRYVMNYLKYACEYKNTLEQTFRKYKNTDKTDDDEDNNEGGDGSNQQARGQQQNNNSNNPFAAQLLEIMDLLHHNLEWKSKLYKDLALCNIFLMNNGRYIMQKIKGSPDLNQLLGDTWRRKRSSAIQQYHKNYQRETWSKLLACLRDDGLMVKGHVQKPLLKERFKNFNAMFDEIHKTQSTWVVSDEQLQSELRVSIAAVVVPAYRSFLGRFAQHFTPGRQTEKYIKFGADDLESYIDELFDGNPSSLASKRRG